MKPQIWPSKRKNYLGSLVLVVENLRNPEALDSALRGLGARHVKYGALPEHYPLSWRCFIDYFRTISPREMDDRMLNRLGWMPMVQLVEIMLDGAEYSEAEFDITNF